ncbi:hypothetical protein MVES1_000052 [Malassezia vespertilionis]|uniref:Purine nucleoside permease n=1 Tax=Malassezia vespertilionis TaxID=2020962 RepID=A0A2N1JFM6_9BASI|nr:uncharacterized protein MVES1_000052 [Malassezia vespertilionis]PKI85351.1 hypothetical protein MVES_000048 [Malassezia vespertilionis]WFD04728.1 hypothetical protein MVES1_000052 [Malassezia vespertilionis]
MKLGFFFFALICELVFALAQEVPSTSSPTDASSALAGTPSPSASPLADSAPSPPVNASSSDSTPQKMLTPRIVVVTAFQPERDVWESKSNFTQHMDLPGMSPRYPTVSCNEEGHICLFTTGEGEINAASSMSAFMLNPIFNLSQSYFLVNGIAGINPDAGTIGSAAFPRYAIQFGLQYGIDPRSMPQDWNYSYWSYGTKTPGVYPTQFYGTEVFELNSALQDKAQGIAQNLTLNDSNAAADFRKPYLTQAATGPPAVFQGDVLTSDLYFTGELMGQMAANFTGVMTNHTGSYAVSAQEDNAVLEVLVRGTKAGIVDYGRAILFRTASNFDRAPPGMADYDAFQQQNNTTELAAPAFENLFIVGNAIVNEIVDNWDTWAPGVPSQAKSSYGDVFGTLGQ